MEGVDTTAYNLVAWLADTQVKGFDEAIRLFGAVSFPWYVAIQEYRNIVELFEASRYAIVCRWIKRSKLALEVSIHEDAISGELVYQIVHPEPGSTTADFDEAVQLCRAHLA